MTSPTLLCIGAQKSGTTWLYRALEQQAGVGPNIWVPPVKELHFWDEKVHHRVGWSTHLHQDEPVSLRWKRQLRQERQRRHRRDSRGHIDGPSELARKQWCGSYFFTTPTVEWYQGLFEGHQHSIDVTPDYAVIPAEGIDRVVQAMPEIKVIYLLRHPVEREWSAAQMAVRGAGRSEEIALRMNRRHAHYYRNIVRWQRRLLDGHLYVGFFEDIALRPAQLLQSILDFAGCPTHDRNSLQLPAGKPNAGNVESIPARFASGIARDLVEDSEQLAKLLGGPANTWLQSVRGLAQLDPGSDDLVYPFPMGRDIQQQESVSSVIL